MHFCLLNSTIGYIKKHIPHRIYMCIVQFKCLVVISNRYFCLLLLNFWYIFTRIHNVCTAFATVIASNAAGISFTDGIILRVIILVTKYVTQNVHMYCISGYLYVPFFACFVYIHACVPFVSASPCTVHAYRYKYTISCLLHIYICMPPYARRVHIHIYTYALIASSFHTVHVFIHRYTYKYRLPLFISLHRAPDNHVLHTSLSLIHT